jgi:murein DD-endopeptidase
MFYFARHPRSTLGLTSETPRQAWLALRGDPSLPGSRFGLSSARLFTPRLAASTWLGRKKLGRQVPITNLYNHTQTPVEEGWSVRVTQVEDFRGRGLTYDSHNGTDFAIPPGTRVCASAPGRVVAMRNEYNRGGLKVYVDHGDGLLTTYNHLARALLEVGDDVARGQPIALSGYSGLDALASFFSVAPHVHYNVALGGVLTDPFARGDEPSLWIGGDNRPRPARDDDATFTPTRFEPARVAALLDDLQDPERRAAMERIDDVTLRGWQLVIEAQVYPTRFTTPNAGGTLFDDVARSERLALPFAADEWDGAVFADDAGLRATG